MSTVVNYINYKAIIYKCKLRRPEEIKMPIGTETNRLCDFFILSTRFSQSSKLENFDPHVKDYFTQRVLSSSKIVIINLLILWQLMHHLTARNTLVFHFLSHPRRHKIKTAKKILLASFLSCKYFELTF